MLKRGPTGVEQGVLRVPSISKNLAIAPSTGVCTKLLDLASLKGNSHGNHLSKASPEAWSSKLIFLHVAAAAAHAALRSASTAAPGGVLGTETACARC